MVYVHNIDPVIFQIGDAQIRWYGLVFGAGLLLTYFIFERLAKEKKLPLSKKDMNDYLLYGFLGVIVGGRLGSVLSEIPYYLDNPLKALAFWEGGMAFHGGLAGLIVAGLIFSKRKKINFYEVADLTVIPAALALAFGRMANFINSEFYGTPTNLPWGVVFPNVEGARHPVQIYESLKNLLIFSVLWVLKDKNLPKGTLFWLFVSLYGALRFSLELYKDLPPYFLGMTWGQFWSLFMIAGGLVMLYRLNRRSTHKPADEDSGKVSDQSGDSS